MVRRTQFDLDAAQAREHILEGLKIAVDNIDEVVEIIKKSKDVPDAQDTTMSAFMTTEIPELFATTYLSEFGVSHLSDNIVLLQYEPSESTINRTLTVLKTRASHHHAGVHPYSITPAGIALTDTHRTANTVD